MDQEEAERLARAIRKAPVDWIEVLEIAFDPVTLTSVLTCAYRQGHTRLLHAQDHWTRLSITSPRQWIDLLTKHRADLELPETRGNPDSKERWVAALGYEGT